jgi:hypothetical protein
VAAISKYLVYDNFYVFTSYDNYKYKLTLSDFRDVNVSVKFMDHICFAEAPGPFTRSNLLNSCPAFAYRSTTCAESVDLSTLR